VCPALLKRVGKSFEELGAVEVQDLTLHMDLDVEGQLAGHSLVPQREPPALARPGGHECR